MTCSRGFEDSPFSTVGLEVLHRELDESPDTELFSFFEDLGSSAWNWGEEVAPAAPWLQDTEPACYLKPAETKTIGHKRSFSAASDATELAEFPSPSHSLSSYESCNSTISMSSICTNSPHEDSGAGKPEGRMTAMEIFHEFTHYYKDEHGNLFVDASGIISRECYEKWLASRKQVPARPEETFRKSILCHCTSSDGGSAPFAPEVEAALLTILRQPGKVWPCFQGQLDKHGKPIRIGLKGLRATGYHEKKSTDGSEASKKRRFH